MRAYQYISPNDEMIVIRLASYGKEIGRRRKIAAKVHV
jgi:hypothetical protein